MRPYRLCTAFSNGDDAVLEGHTDGQVQGCLALDVLHGGARPAEQHHTQQVGILNNNTPMRRCAPVAVLCVHVDPYTDIHSYIGGGMGEAHSKVLKVYDL